MPLEATPAGVRVRLRAQPGASRDRVMGVVELGDGRRAVKVAVRAPPEDGKANAALVQLLAKIWGVPRTSISVVQGATDRTKLLAVSGDPDALMARLGPWLADLAPGGDEGGETGHGRRDDHRRQGGRRPGSGAGGGGG